MKKGFGLLEVLAAAIVLGFLVVGLLRLQLGNHEAIVRIRARDAANIIAQHVLDSLGAVGINSIQDTVPNEKIIDNKPREYAFDGKDETPMKFYVKVEYLSSASGSSNSSTNNAIDVDTDINETSPLTESESPGGSSNKFAKNVLATVSWKFNGSEQSIKMYKVLR